ncbi:MAG: hypothetical protein KJO75_03285 [Dactylosporangium sp.]|nr:hypothetical protein [Dactylosporangium sp.]
MRFQLRVLGLVGMVAVVATGATSWITLGVTSRLWGKSEEAARREVEVITQTLVAYGRQHGTWEGVDAAVTDLTRRTGQRIRLVTEYDEVVVDSDNLAGRAARPPPHRQHSSTLDRYLIFQPDRSPGNWPSLPAPRSTGPSATSAVPPA